ncbi:carbohydrate kinase family protein [Fodinicola acaciae]|uniref:carbohydrate kinase family protein n=1 Tax=Fodinicola acaciae TaxID=2681555 RepID=UPI001C9E75E4|nr:carbohydrate kinase family protein [Fodinicola acaciae]
MATMRASDARMVAMRPTPIAVVGDLVTDVVALLSGPVEADTDTPARVRITGGGAAANTAAWLGSLGTPVTLICAVGGDGQARIDELAGVDVAAQVVGEPTGTIVVLVRPDGGRSLLPDRGANEGLSADHVRRALDERRPAHVHVSGYALMGRGSRAAGLAAIAWSREHSVTSSATLASVAPLRAVGPKILDWLDGVDLLLANEDEAAVVTGESEVAAKVLARGRTAAVVTRGARGAVWSDGDSVVACDAARATVVDTTGAGDAFAAGVLASLADGPAAALAAGCALAARCIAHPGARPVR